MKKNNFIAVLLLVAFAAYAQKPLVITKGNRKRTFKPGTELVFIGMYTNLKGDTIEMECTATIVSVLNDSITLRPTVLHENITTKDGRKLNTHRTSRYDSLAQVVLPLKSISKIKKEQAKGSTLSSSIMGGSIAGIITGPIYCFDGEGHFSFAEYGFIAAVSVAALAITIPLSICFEYRTFKMKGAENGWKVRM